jgi:hypothetical protein
MGASLEPWTLLTWIAATTSRIRVATRVDEHAKPPPNLVTGPHGAPEVLPAVRAAV